MSTWPRAWQPAQTGSSGGSRVLTSAATVEKVMIPSLLTMRTRSTPGCVPMACMVW